jgi:hypothetical protein
MSEKCKKTAAVLFSIVAIAYANISYASSFSINKIASFLNKGVVATSISSEGEVLRKLTTVENFVDQTFRVNFAVPKTGDPDADAYGVPPDRLELFMGDSTAENNRRLISKTSKGINPVENADNMFFPCFLIDSFSEEADGSSIYKNFTITITDIKGSITETIKAEKPKLSVSLKKNKTNGEYDTLMLENLGTEEIRVTDVIDGAYIVKEGVSTLALSPYNRRTHEIKLSFVPDLESKLKKAGRLRDDGNQFHRFNDAIVVVYEVGDDGISVQGVIDIVCDDSKEVVSNAKEAGRKAVEEELCQIGEDTLRDDNPTDNQIIKSAKNCYKIGKQDAGEEIIIDINKTVGNYTRLGEPINKLDSVGSTAVKNVYIQVKDKLGDEMFNEGVKYIEKEKIGTKGKISQIIDAAINQAKSDANALNRPMTKEEAMQALGKLNRKFSNAIAAQVNEATDTAANSQKHTD